MEEFDAQRLEKHHWTHQAHLIVAIYYVKKFEFYEAICKIKSGIILLNKFHKTENSATSGYHETITIFWATVIKGFIDKNTDFDIEQTVNSFLNSKFSKKDYLFEFYEKEYLMSAKLRAIYQEGTRNKNVEL